MTDTDWIRPGRRVCVAGRGTAATVHRHPTIERLTKTQIICDSGDRFQVDTLQSVPYQPYGGAYIYPTCQRKDAK